MPKQRPRLIEIIRNKQVNDVHGRLVGDRVLRAVAALLAEQIRG